MKSNARRSNLWWLHLLILVVLPGLVSGQKIVSIKAMGARGDGQFNNTQIIQKAIDECHAAGGGTVWVEQGSYLTATLILKSNVTIHIEAGAAIKASTRTDDYQISKGIFSVETNVPVLFYGEGLENITFSGRGLIDGQAQHTWEPLREVDKFIEWETENARQAGVEMFRAYAKDPKVSLIYLNNCKNVTIRDLRLERSPNWTVHLANCENVLATDLYIFSSLDMGVNADGLDIDGCRHVRVANCNIITGDDAICLKSTVKNGLYHDCRDVTVTNCNLVSTSTALKIGTESHGNFSNIVFSNSTISNTNRGIGIFVRDGATVDGVIFSNLTIACNRKHFNWWGDGDPIRIVLLKRRPESRLGMIQNILINHVVARGQGTSLIAGFNDKPIKNIKLAHVSLILEAESTPDKRAKEVLRISRAEHVDLDNVHLQFDYNKPEPRWTSLLLLQHVAQSHVANSKFYHRHSDVKQAAVVAEHVSEVIFSNNICRYGVSASFFHFSGAETRQITLSNNYPEPNQKLYTQAATVAKSQIKSS